MACSLAGNAMDGIVVIQNSDWVMSLCLLDPDRWRRRAAETRTLGERLKEPETKRMMLDVADAYDRLAIQVQEQLDVEDTLVPTEDEWRP